MAAEISVVVPSHDRPLRLRWLLNALESQTLALERFEVVVVHDSQGNETDKVLREHPLQAAGRLRWCRLPAGTGPPGHQRNVGWRMAIAAQIAFTDDDCRPEPDWLSLLLETASRHPGAIVQGRTRPDPFEIDLLLAPHSRTLEVDPPSPFAQTCNILYPRRVLERTGGFKEHIRLSSGEDTDLALRARATGAPYVDAGEAIVNHAVEAFSLLDALRVTRKWADLAYVVKAHPQMRDQLAFGLFWRPRHASLLLAAAGLLMSRRKTVRWALSIPYLSESAPDRRPRALLRSILRLPGRLVIDAYEIFTCLRGALRHRTPFL